MPKRIGSRSYNRDQYGSLADRRQRRLSLPPAGVCTECWRERRSDTQRGRFYVWGFPSLTPGQGRALCYCDACADILRAINVELIPAGRRPAPTITEG
jgi:hypothetical protein